MKRTRINRAIAEAQALAATFRFALPGWATWTREDHRANADTSAFLTGRQIGWDVTDFGAGRFDTRGLTLLCLRNGRQGDPAERPYAEKLLFVGEGQETPFHCHKVKLEDIIVRGGGHLMVEFTHDGSLMDLAGEARVDGRRVDPFAGPIRLTAGQSITIPRGLQHRFWGAPGQGTVFAAEVSQCNDDLHDNFFLEPLGRFAAIEEDAPATLPLWNEARAP